MWDFVLAAFGWFRTKIAEPFWQLFEPSWKWIVAGMVAFAAILKDVVEFATGTVGLVIECLDACTQTLVNIFLLLAVYVPWQILAWCNSLIPLVDGMLVLALWGCAWSAMLVYRFAKSWIPTVS